MAAKVCMENVFMICLVSVRAAEFAACRYYRQAVQGASAYGRRHNFMSAPSCAAVQSHPASPAAI